MQRHQSRRRRDGDPWAEAQEKMATQGRRYDRAVTTLLSSLAHSGDVVRRALYVAASSIDGISDKAERRREALWRNIVAVDETDAFDDEADTQPTLAQTAGSETVASASLATSDALEAAERHIIRALEIEAGASTSSCGKSMSIRGADHALRADPKLMRADRRMSRLHASVAECATQTTMKYSDNDAAHDAACRANEAIDAVLSKVDSLEGLVYGLAEKVLAEHNSLVRWARHLHNSVRDSVALSPPSSDALTLPAPSTLSIPSLPDFAMVTRGSEYEDRVRNQELAFRTRMACRHETTCMQALDRDAAAPVVGRNAMSCAVQVCPSVGHSASQTVTPADPVAQAARAQHAAIEELLTSVRHCSNRLWGLDC
jgi:hypothetical protein